MNERSSALAWRGGVFGMAGAKRKAPLKGGLRIAIGAVADALAALPLSGMIIGGVAVIARGVPWSRAWSWWASSPALRARSALRQPIKCSSCATPRAGSISIAWLPFETEAIAAAESLELAGAQVRVARAEDLVIYKAIAFRPQDQQDIERLATPNLPKRSMNQNAWLKSSSC